MKKHLFIISTLFFSVLGFSQGIEFENCTWKEVLEKAKQTNKPIFIDVSTSWCGPCKMMVKDIFTLPEVGKVYNANFICYKIDAEKGEGIEIAKNYKVTSYPTYLFIKYDGALFFMFMGSMSADNFIGVSKSALAEMNKTNPLADWEKEYAVKKDDPKFLYDYMIKRFKLGKSNSLLFNEYLNLFPEERRTSDTISCMYMLEGHYLKVNSLSFQNLEKNKNIFSKKLPVNTYLYDGIVNSVYEAAQSKDEQLLNIAIQAYSETLNDPLRKSKDELYMEYYSLTGELESYMSYAMINS